MISNRKSPHNNMAKKERTREAVYVEYVIEAIAYMECQPANHVNVKCRKQLREVAQYLSALGQSARLAEKAANND